MEDKFSLPSKMEGTISTIELKKRFDRMTKIIETKRKTGNYPHKFCKTL